MLLGIFAEHLSMRLLILQSMFLVSRVWAQLPSCFRNAIKGVACVQTSVLLGSAIKCVHLCKFIVFSTVAALVVSLSRLQNGKNFDGSEEERARSLPQKRKRRQRAQMQPQPHEVRIENDEYERE